MSPPDYARLARQIALPELGPEGQESLSMSALHAPAQVRALAAELWRRAGGGDHCVALDLDARAIEVARATPIGALGVAAWSCVESARRALGEVPAPIPEELLERLGAPRAQ